MNFDLSEDQLILRNQARRFLTETVNYDRLRKLILAGDDFDAELWARIAELGWPGVIVPEQYGGLGLSLLDQCVITEELGRAVAAVPFIASCGIAAEAILRLGSEAQKRALLPAIAAGQTRATLAFFEGAGVPDAASMSSFTTQVSHGRLSGTKFPVTDLGDMLLVCARDASGIGLFVVRMDTPGVSCARIEGFDQLRGGWRVELTDVPCDRLGDRESADVLANLFDRAAVLTAFEQVGGAQAALEMAQAYALDRRAFGRVIGSFQAVKHKLADMLTKIELARSNAYYAGWAAGQNAPDAALAAASARISATEAYEFAARENMQIHGGISFTWEANCHFHYRRARLLATTLGAASFWSRRIISLLMQARLVAAEG